MHRLSKNFAVLLMITPLLLRAQATDDHQLILQLADEVRALRAEVSRLKGEAPAVATVAPVPPTPPAAGPTPPPQALLPSTASAPAAPATSPVMGPEDMDSHDHTMSIPDGPELHFRGFFDVDFDDGPVAQSLQYPLGVPAHTSFRS